MASTPHRQRAAVERLLRPCGGDCGEPKAARLLLRRLVGPLTLWDAAEPSSEWIEWEASATAGLLEGLAPIQVVAATVDFPVTGSALFRAAQADGVLAVGAPFSPTSGVVAVGYTHAFGCPSFVIQTRVPISVSINSIVAITNLVSVRLTKKLAAILNGVDVSSLRVGDIIELPTSAAQMMIAEGWAEPAPLVGRPLRELSPSHLAN